MLQLREVLVEKSLAAEKKQNKEGEEGQEHQEEDGYSIFKRIPIFQEELKERLSVEIPKARERFDAGDFPIPSRIKKCRTYPIYQFVRTEVGTEMLSGVKKVSPGECIEKVYEAIGDGKMGDVLMKCLAFWRGSAGPFTPRPSVASPAHCNPEYWGWFDRVRSPSATSGRGYWNL